MPVYHFHITDGQKVHDPRGLDLPDEIAALRYAEQLARGFVPVANILNGEVETCVKVVDERGRCAVNSPNADDHCRR